MKISTNQIDEIFDSAATQNDYVIKLYELIFGKPSDEIMYSKFPRAGKIISHYIWDKAIAFDKEKHPEVLAGGAWLNYGFSTDENIDPDEIIIGENDE